MIYLVGQNGDVYKAVTEAETPEQAALEWIADRGEDVDCEVWTAIKCLPEIDVKESFDSYGEDNPEFSPLDEPWSSFMSPKAIATIQSELDKMIRDRVKPWYAADKLVYTHKGDK